MNKKKLARKLITKKELKTKTPIFQSKNWELRKAGIANKVANKKLKVQKQIINSGN